MNDIMFFFYLIIIPLLTLGLILNFIIFVIDIGILGILMSWFGIENITLELDSLALKIFSFNFIANIISFILTGFVFNLIRYQIYSLFSSDTVYIITSSFLSSTVNFMLNYLICFKKSEKKHRIIYSLVLAVVLFISQVIFILIL